MTDSLPRTVLIAGCGYVGLALCRHLHAAGCAVWGLRRDPNAAGLIVEAGGAPVIADLLRPETLASLPPVEAVVSCQAPRRGRDGYRETYLEATRNLLLALERRPPKTLLCISSTRVYGEARGAWVDEATPPEPDSDEGRILLEAERLVLSSSIPSMVLRLAGIYGPGRDRRRLLSAPQETSELSGYLNQIHLDDVVGVIALLLSRGTPGEVYLGVDEEPVSKAVFYPWLAEQAGIDWPTRAGAPAAPSGKRCSNRKLKALGYRFRHPDFRSGFPAWYT